MQRLWVQATVAALFGVGLAAHAEPDEDLLGKLRNYLTGSASSGYNNPYRVGAWSALDKVPGIQTRLVARAAQARAVPRAAQLPKIPHHYDVLGRVLTATTGKTMAELTSDWLWKPMGAEHDAFWRVSIDGQAQSFGAFNASLRNWGRLGLLLANDGRVNGQVDGQVKGRAGTQQVILRDYLLNATGPARQPAAFKPRKATPYLGYGYQFWLMPLKELTFAVQGIYGQTVSGLVLTSVWESASGKQNVQPYKKRDALWRGVLRSLDGSSVE